MPQHFRKKDGKKKKAYSRTQAERLAKQYHMHCYKCDECGEWHLAKKRR